MFDNLHKQLNRISKVKLGTNRLKKCLISNTWTSINIFLNIHIRIQLHCVNSTACRSAWSPKLQSDHFILNLMILINKKKL